MPRSTLIILAAIAPVVASNPLPLAAESAPRRVVSQEGMVVSVSTPASEVGARVLNAGGNAVDAAVATAFALAVTYPQAGNIGGGGFMLVAPAGEPSPTCIEYRETAPGKAHATMFSLSDSRLGPKSVGVPGTVRGMELAHKTYGRLTWNQLLKPAVRLAREGFRIDDQLARSLNNILADKYSAPFEEMRRVFTPPAGRVWRAGDRLQQPELATTLARIAQQGADGFYSGETARAIVSEMRSGDGIISLADLSNYRAKIRKPIHGTYRGYDIFGPPPPSSGGIVLIQMLNVLERYDLRELGRDSPETAHLIIESMRRGFLDRARYLGDQDFVAIPSRLTSKRYAEEMAATIDVKRATSSEALAPDISLAPETPSTTHFSIVDANGMAVSNTYTLEQSYGARVVVHGCGFLLNNEMGDFNWVPGRTDRVGRIGTKPNLIEPGKRMLSSQTPVIVMKNGRVYLAAGSPGGRTIISTVLGVVLNVLEFEMDLPAAVAAPRWHHQWQPDVVRFEGSREPQYTSLVNQLRELGHKFLTEPAAQGDAHCIRFIAETGHIIGVADTRISGAAVAVESVSGDVTPD